MTASPTSASRPSPLLETLHAAALSLWLCFLATAAISAAIIFPAAKKLNLSLPDYPGFEADHWRIAAGQIQQRIFFFCDSGQLICCILAVLTLGLLLVLRKLPGRGTTALRVLTLSAASVVFAFYLMVLAPRMAVNANQYWSAAKSGDTAAASAAHALFEADHPTASNCLGATGLFVLTALIAGVYSAAAPRDGAAA